MNENENGQGLAEMMSRVGSQESSSPELVFGLVGPLGCNINAVQQAIADELQKVGYSSDVIHITKYAQEIFKIDDKLAGTFEEKINLMNKLVGWSKSTDFLARLAVTRIMSFREESNTILGIKDDSMKILTQINNKAYIIRQLKRSQEVNFLRKIYGRKFIQVSVVVSEEEQFESVNNIVARENPEKLKFEREKIARELIERDRNEINVTFGQRTIDAYHSADLFLGGSVDEINYQAGRFIQAFFGSNYISPTKDEIGSYLAKAASLRTLDLSRQVGAAITNSDGDIISMGSNEVPRPGGGNYWCDDPDPQRDIERGMEANKHEIMLVIHNFVHALSGHKEVKMNPSELLKDEDFNEIIKKTLVSDLTEFGRMTHAEMSALADAARLGRSTRGATIYVTTFPCHNCAKHLIAAGISRIVYIEPYTKSKAFELSGDALCAGQGVPGKVSVQHFLGISPRRFRDIFEKPNKRRDDDNNIRKWHYGKSTPMLEDKLWTHTIAELIIFDTFSEQRELVEAGLSSSIDDPASEPPPEGA